ncbi:hypothetical protein AQUSIP_18310 [Aquicella siphonis]|uniref:Uncharacterized protein n=1 Tax=Aquicella siphonis TaxID=254247 RepID=A0A5E4PJ81_9COXI|nr:hypothetical protein [Aquicella siphonis]VVC76518.1 hypothetical protein AQUSIP_18310 [Aquicella siphonis]
MWPILKSIKTFFKSRLNSWQKALTVLGCMTGAVLSIGLIAGGIAAIPFTGGASLMPAWLGMIFFIVLVTGSFGSAGKYIGMSIDTLISNEKPTNEKIATVAGCLVGLIVSVLAIPLHSFGVGFIAEHAAVAAWEVILPFIPLTIGAFGSACSYIGRSIDALTNNKTIFDLFRKYSRAAQKQREQMPLMSSSGQAVRASLSVKCDDAPGFRNPAGMEQSPANLAVPAEGMKRCRSAPCLSLFNPQWSRRSTESMQSRFTQCDEGIKKYLDMSKVTDSHLGFFARHFDRDRGKARAQAYLSLLNNAKTAFEQGVIAYALLAAHDGKTLKNIVCAQMGFHSLREARNKLGWYIRQSLASRAELRLLENEVISRIVKYTNDKKSYASGCYDDALEILETLARSAACASNRMQFTQSGNDMPDLKAEIRSIAV